VEAVRKNNQVKVMGMNYPTLHIAATEEGLNEFGRFAVFRDEVVALLARKDEGFV